MSAGNVTVMSVGRNGDEYVHYRWGHCSGFWVISPNVVDPNVERPLNQRHSVDSALILCVCPTPIRHTTSKCDVIILTSNDVIAMTSY